MQIAPRRFLSIILVMILTLFSVSVWSINLSPNTNGGSGQLPSGFPQITFTTADNN